MRFDDRLVATLEPKFAQHLRIWRIGTRRNRQPDETGWWSLLVAQP